MRRFALSVLLVFVASCGTEAEAPAPDHDSSEQVDLEHDTSGSEDEALSDVHLSVEEIFEVTEDVDEGPNEVSSEDEVVSPPDDAQVEDSSEEEDATSGLDDALGAEDVDEEVSESEEVAQPEPIVIEGDQCDAPIAVDSADLPFEYSGDTTHAQDDISLAGGCGTGGDIGSGAPDIMFSFTPQLSAHHVLGINPATVHCDWR